MMKTFKEKHIGYYASLILIIILGFFLVTAVSYNKNLQMLVVVVTSFFYVLWGIIHHSIHHDLTAKIVIEYVLMGSFGLAVALFYLKGVI